MSKSLRNYPDVREVFDRDGSDAMRWFLMSSPILRGGNLVVTEQGIRDGVRQVLIPLWNAWYFFSLYANAFGGGEGYDARWSTSSHRRAGPLPAGQTLRDLVDARAGPARRVRRRAACQIGARLPGRADQLVHPAVARAVLGGEDDASTEAFDTLYTTLEVRDPGRGAAAAVDDRGDLARADRWAQRAPDRLAGRERPAGRRRPGRGDGPHPRGLLGGAGACARPRRCGSGCRCRP